MKTIFEMTGHSDLRNYLELCNKFRPLDIEKVFNLTLQSIKYYRGDKSVRAFMHVNQEMEKKWYDSLEKGEPLYSIYDDDYYVGDIWACWIVYSRGYLKLINKYKQIFGNPESILDLGCGQGFTTAALKEIFPNSDVFGCNIEETVQFKVAEEIGIQRNFKVIGPNMVHARKFDMIFASEFFEHVEKPIDLLVKLINSASPKILVLANSFSSRSVGHFPVYKVGNKLVENTKIAHEFNNTLRNQGYRRAEVKFWNNRPAIWLKNK